MIWHQNSLNVQPYRARIMRVFWLVILLCLDLAKSLPTNQTEEKLIFAQIIFRHGDRTIRFPYPNDPNKDKSHWPEGFGQLTNDGKRRSYELGQFFSRRYQSLLGDGSYSADKIFVLSSDVDRTINSASSVLAGLFKPKNDQVWNQNLLWQPIPVHTIPQSIDNLIIAEGACPKYIKLLNEQEHSTEIQTVLQKYEDLFRYIEDHTGQTIHNLEQLRNIQNTIEVEKEMDKIIPEWAEKIMVPGSDLEYLGKYWLKLNTNTPELKRLKSGFLLKEILDRFKNKTLSLLPEDSVLWLYSGHDTTIAGLLNTLDVFELHYPPYSSSLLFELYASQNEFYVQLFYRNDATDNPTLINIPNCGTKCNLNKFYELYEHILASDFKTECATE